MAYPKKRPFVASLDQVRITRREDHVIIDYADPEVWSTNYQLGPRLHEMTDQQILDVRNEHLRADEKLMAEYVHVCREIPAGRPQLRYDELAKRWTSRGDVIKGVIRDAEPGPVFDIDGNELTLQEFGQLLSTYYRWGFRLYFVPDNELHDEPAVNVQDPDEADA